MKTSSRNYRLFDGIGFNWKRLAVALLIGWGIFILRPAVCAGATNAASEVVIVPLQDLMKNTKDTVSVSNVVVMLKANLVQRATEGGVRVCVEMVNQGPDHLVLFNPLDGMNMQLLNETGWPIKLPVSIGRGFIDSRSREERETFRLPFKVEKALFEDRPMTQEEFHSFSLRLPAKGRVAYHLLLDRMMEKSPPSPQIYVDGVLESKGKKEIPIPAGVYQVDLCVGVTLFSDIRAFRRLQSRAIRIELRNE